ncbi:TP901 family phage tail tape measure protein [Microbacterium marinum]|uniref:TP901 family phage tail tape measure protein n=1 Tax=Microbacterium marinum TaxID=421115 RepID=A0A7W7BQT9_9MICO|nr:phage tail tape measure protein [Microbacterium marinum]MBB4667095.1 TP901 family phage tail tape measure protein [Microbacterium marinum]
MYDGLSQDAQMRLKIVLEGVRDLNAMVEMLGGDAPAAGRKAVTAISEINDELKKTRQAANDSGSALQKSAKEADAAWKKAVQGVKDYNAEYQRATRNKVLGISSDGERPFSSFSEAEKDRILAIDDAARADIVGAIRTERREHEELAKAVIAGEERMAAAAEKRAEAERMRARESADRGRSSYTTGDFDRDFAALSGGIDASAEAERKIALARLEAERRERELLAQEVVAGEARMAAATNKRVEAERALARESTARGRRNAGAEWDRELIGLQDEIARKTATTNENLISQRYALYDVASTAGIAGGSLVALVSAYTMLAANREAAFTDVLRTTRVDADSELAVTLRKELEELAQEIPKSFAEISDVATKAAQLDIPVEGIQEFTEATIKFSAVTGVASDTAALSFGKIGNVLGLAGEEYTQFASAVAYAGVRSAATEEQILSVANKLGPVMAQYRATADEVAGLSAAYASVGVESELSAGTTGRVWAKIQLAVDQGGTTLENFARVSGMSSEQFRSSWGESAANTFVTFVGGLQHVENYNEALRSLGIEATRDGRSLGALSAGVDKAVISMQAAREGMSNGFLDESAAQIFDTVVSKLQLVLNAFDRLAGVVGGSTLEAFGGLLDVLADTLNNLAEFGSNPVGQFFLGLGMILTGLIGVLLLFGGALAGGTAALFAIRTAITGLQATATGAQLTMLQFIGGLFGVQAAGNAAAGGMNAAAMGARALRVAMISTGIGAVVAILGTLIGAAVTAGDQEENLATSADKANQELAAQEARAAAAAEEIRKLTQELNDAVEAANAMAMGSADLEGSLFDLGQSMQQNGKQFDAYSTGGRENMRSLSSAIAAAVAIADGDAQLLANLLAGIREQLLSIGAGADAIAMVERAIEATGVAATDAIVTSNSLAVGFAHVDENARNAAKGVDELGEKVRTVSDYASDLGSIMDRAFEIRFGAQDAYDRVLDTYDKMRSEAKRAAESIDDLRAQIMQTEADLRVLQGERVGQEYFLSVATRYGDTARAAAISGDIARNSADQNSARTEIRGLNGQVAEEQDALTRSIEGNSEAARRNREALDELAQEHMEYLEALAASGASQETLEAETRRLKDEFIDFGVSMGYNADDLEQRYGPAYDDVAKIIREFPRDITVDIDGLDPAQAALNEWLEKNKDHRIDVPVNVQANKNVTAEKFTDVGQIAGNSFKTAFATAMVSGAQAGAAGASVSKNNQPSFWEQIYLNWQAGLDAAFGALGFSEGGYTGDGGKHDVAGLAHKGEYVFPQEAVRYYGVENLARAHRVALRGYSSGGLVGGPAGAFGGSLGMEGGGPLRLDASTIDALAQAMNDRPVFLMADSRVIAQLVSTGNAAYTRGS